MLKNDVIEISQDISQALAANRSVVALESTVIAHGLPRPENLQTALALEAIVSSAGAVAATVAVLKGKLRVGLTHDELQFLAQSDEIKKISMRDLPIAVTRDWNAATTVATTVWIAAQTGIKVLATGGIGGVHRGSPADVSADLVELARTAIIVVCSGAKIVLDLPATREWLETHGITIVGYRCDELPAFYSRRSGLPIDVRADSTIEIVKLFQAQRKLGLESALLVASPVPEEFEIASDQLQSFIDSSLAAATRTHVSGRELTPFLLSHMASLSGGATLRANIALLKNNALLASQIATAAAWNES
ncbi:MAG: pseudouridine-5'-phosphate glycosidase [Pyrinomonadaceae bacterium]